MSLLQRVLHPLKGEGAKARSLRGMGVTALSIFGSNGMRLISNLVLTRLLFPEAFGLMALVQVFVIGLQMFSDIGINTSIMQHKRGDDADFLNTAWTLQIIRGVGLWLCTFAVAVPASYLYDEPMLLYLLPLVGLSAVFNGFRPTKVVTAARHIRLARQTMLNLISQVLGLVILALLAWSFRSVWALAVGSVISSAIGNLMLHLFMPGPSNRFRWERSTVSEIMGFGKFIFLSTLSSFLISQGDKAILGAYLSKADLGIYSIALMLGTVPGMLIHAIARNVFFPLYRIRPPAESRENQRKIFAARRWVSALAVVLSTLLGLYGIQLIGFLYDPRYALAGPMIVVFSLRVIPSYSFMGGAHVLNANGDSRGYFILTFTMAMCQTLAVVAGIHSFGIGGAILAPMAAGILTYPLRAMMVNRYAAWDPAGELGLMALGILSTGFCCWLYWDQVQVLFT